MIRLIVDSTCDLPQEIMDRYGILMLPLHVLVNGTDYRDKVDITADEVFAAMRQGVVPKTAQVGPEDVYQVFQGCCDRGEDFVYLSFSAALSGTYQLAKAIMNEFEQKYTNLKMQMVDSKGGSIAIGLMALQGVKMIEDGHPFEAVVKNLAFLSEHVEHIFTIADIGWLVKGGRISKLQGVLGSILDIRPVLHVKNGLMEVIKKARGGQKALGLVVDTMLERIGAFPDQIIAISHSDNVPGVEKLKRMLTDKMGAQNFIISQIGSVLGTHLGINALGVFFFNQKPDVYDGSV